MFRYLPPIWAKPGKRSNNSLFGIYIGKDDPHAAAVLAQEYRENTFAWLTAYLPCFAGIGFACFVGSELAIIIGIAVAVLSIGISASKPVRAYRGVRGQVTEAVAAAWLYDTPLADEIEAAARQLKGGHYASAYGLESMSPEDVEEVCWRLVPDAERWVNNHRKLLTDGFRWLEP